MTRKTLLFWCGMALVCTPAWGEVGKLTKQWIERPWEYRYLLYVRDPYGWMHARESHVKDVNNDPVNAYEYSIDLPVYFDPQWTLTPKVPEDEAPQLWPALNVVRLDVAKDRKVAQRALNGDVLRARLNGHEDIVLTPSDTDPAYVITFGEFFMGAPEAADPRYSPSICSTLHGDTVPPGTTGRYAYRVKDTDSPEGFFGCREWAAQLYDRDRPYIDVTSYEMVEDYDKKPNKKGKYPLKPATYIKPFIGFSRFSDPHKPVIGKYGEQWYCITDCPSGEAPGEIADIQAWAARFGWKPPQRPKNPRQFINKRVDPGEFID